MTKKTTPKNTTPTSTPLIPYAKNSWKYQAITHINQILKQHPEGLSNLEMYHLIIDQTQPGKRIQRSLTPSKLRWLLQRHYPVDHQETPSRGGNPRNIYTLPEEDIP